MKYPKTEECIPKIGIRLDNTTATKTWIGLHEPQLIEHAGAKEMRILGWHERVAFVDRLPIHTAYCPGELNSFSDLVSRIAAKMGEIAAAKKASRQGPAAHHMSAHSFEQEDQRDIPEGFRARHLRLSIDDERRDEGPWRENVRHIQVCDRMRRADSREEEQDPTMDGPKILRCGTPTN